MQQNFVQFSREDTVVNALIDQLLAISQVKDDANTKDEMMGLVVNILKCWERIQKESTQSGLAQVPRP